MYHILNNDPFEPVFRALANPYRRKVLDLLRDGPLTVGDLSVALPELSRFAVMQHLKKLEAASLVVSRKKGRQRFNFLNPVPIQQVYERWVSQYTAPFAAEMVAIKNDLEAGNRPGDDSPASSRKRRAKQVTRAGVRKKERTP